MASCHSMKCNRSGCESSVCVWLNLCSSKNCGCLNLTSWFGSFYAGSPFFNCCYFSGSWTLFSSREPGKFSKVLGIHGLCQTMKRAHLPFRHQKEVWPDTMKSLVLSHFIAMPKLEIEDISWKFVQLLTYLRQFFHWNISFNGKSDFQLHPPPPPSAYFSQKLLVYGQKWLSNNSSFHLAKI